MGGFAVGGNMFSGVKFPGIDQAIATQEGFGTAGSLATINNNPGNLVYNTWTASQGATAGKGGFAAYPTVSAGVQAMDQNVSHYASQGATLSQLTAAWAPAGQGNNDPVAYAQNIANATGLSPTSPVSAGASVGANSAAPAGQTGTTNPFASVLGMIQKGAVTAAVGAATATGQAPGSPSVSGTIADATSTLLFGLPVARVAGLFGGLILIGGAIYLYRPQAVNSVVRSGAKAGAALL